MIRNIRVHAVLAFLMACCCLAPAAVAQQCPSFPTTPPDINNPTQIAQTAWQIFVAATCPTSSNPTQYPFVKWETWTQQTQLYPTTNTLAAFTALRKLPPEKRFHTSPLAMALANRKTAKATAPASTPAGPNTCPNPAVTIWEEIRISPDAASYIVAPVPGDSLAFRGPQAAFATGPPPPFFPPLPSSSGWNGGNINFPLTAVELKIDWIEFPAPCPTSLSGQVWTETYGSKCYALAGMHLISKLLPNWIWATFEPQNMTTNPNRCVVLGCNDPFGSSPATTPSGQPGTTTNITPALQTMMTNAGLNPVWQNYRLDGVQVQFTNSDGSPTLLGNSIIECENAGVPLTQASCITCHSVSGINAAGTDGITNLGNLGRNPVGPAYVQPPGFAPRDFVWSLMCASPNSNCPPSSGPNLTAARPGKTKK